jgi:dihydroflavonol-4-reductase
MTTPLLNEASNTPVLVTGATGFVAGWLIKRLLGAGAVVHATVRDPANTAKLAHLQAMADASPGTIKFFKADLLDVGSHTEAMAGCEIVFHTASPFLAPFNVKDPQRDLIDPALQGTRDVLESVNATKTVRRVVLTSSCAAIFGEAADVAKAPGGILTEAVWNTTSSLTKNPYSYSKTLAEQAAWALAKAQDRWNLVVVNPALIIGPGTAPTQTSASFDYVRMIGDGTFKDGVPAFQIGMVDVRDVAEAHFRAAFVEAADGRNIVFAEVLGLGDLAGMLKAAFGDAWPFPADTAPPAGIPAWKADNGRSRTILGIDYRPVRTAVVEMFQQLIDSGVVKRA